MTLFHWLYSITRGSDWAFTASTEKPLHGFFPSLLSLRLRSLPSDNLIFYIFNCQCVKADKTAVSEDSQATPAQSLFSQWQQFHRRRVLPNPASF